MIPYKSLVHAAGAGRPESGTTVESDGGEFMTTTHQRRARLSIDVSREARRRIHIAAAKRDQSIRDYVWEAVEARLRHDLADPNGC